jgi:DNA-binding PadR family transcriptional regulator
MIHPDRIAIIRLCVLCRGHTAAIVSVNGGSPRIVYQALQELAKQGFMRNTRKRMYEVTAAGWAVLAYDERLDKPEIREWIHEES